MLLLIIILPTIITTEVNNDSDSDEGEPHQYVIFAVNGLMGQASTARWMPFLHQMVPDHGIYSSRARSIRDHHHIPCWIAHFFAATPAEYGCQDDNECTVPPDAWGYKSFLDVLSYDYNYDIHLCSESPKMLLDATRNRYAVQAFSPTTTDMTTHATDDNQLPQTNRRLLLFHWDIVDIVGRSHGYDSLNYKAQVLCLDQQISEITKSVWDWEPERTTFILISDHGGDGFSRKSFILNALQVPFAMWGYGIESGQDMFSHPISITQTAPTILQTMGYDIPTEWSHKPIDCILGNGYSYDQYKSDKHEDPPLHGKCPIPLDVAHKHISTSIHIMLVILMVFFIIVAS